MSQVARRYSRALFDLALAAKKLDNVLQNVEALAALLEQSPALKYVLISRRFGRQAQQDVLTELVTTCRFEKLVQGFLNVISQNGRLQELGKIISQFQELVRHYKGEMVAQITSALPLSKGDEKKLVTVLEAYAQKKISLATELDKNLVGGLRIRLGSTLIDHSYQTKIQQLYYAMKGV